MIILSRLGVIGQHKGQRKILKRRMTCLGKFISSLFHFHLLTFFIDSPQWSMTRLHLLSLARARWGVFCGYFCSD